MKKTSLLLGVLASLLLTSPADAQRFGIGEIPDFDDEIEAFMAYVALIGTPTGGLPDLPPFWMTGRERARPGVRASFGFIDPEGEGSIRNFGATFDLPIGVNDVGVTLGYFSPDCDGDCDGNIILGADFSRPLLRRQSEGSAIYSLGVQAALGYTKPDVPVSIEGKGIGDVDVSAWSWALGVPLAVAAGGGNVKVVPFVTPSLAWGRVSVSADAGFGDVTIDFDKLRFMLSGGLGLAGLAPGLTVGLNVKKVFVEEGDIMLGLGLVWNGVR